MVRSARVQTSFVALFLAFIAASVVGRPAVAAPDTVSKTARASALTVVLGHALGNDPDPTATIAAATERRAILGSLVTRDPESVLALAVPSRVRAALPPAVRALVEESVTLDGTLDVHVEDGVAGSKVHYGLTTARGHYSLHFAGRGPELPSGARVRVRGVAVGDAMALGKSNGSVTVTQGSSALSNTFGVFRTLVLLVNFADEQTQPYTVETARQVVFDTTSAFDLENSYGQTSLEGDVFGWFTIPMSSSVCDTNQVASLAQQAATSAGVSLSGYTRFVYAFPQNACTWWGYGQIGGSPTNAWVNGSFQLRVVGHEMGHNFGLYHAHSLDCGADVIGTNCTSSEYGDTVDIMGASAWHFSAFQKERLGWIGATGQPPVVSVTSTGTYWLDPYESPGGSAKALKIVKEGTTGNRTFYYVEFRRPIGFDASMSGYSNLMNGVVVHTGSESTANSSYLLDETPGTTTFSDAALDVGRSFTDPNAGVTITPLSVSSAGASVAVDFGGSPCIPASPGLSVGPDSTPWALPGTPVAYTVTVTNHDGTSCGPTSFALTASVPAGWTWTSAAPTLTLQPGATASTTVSIMSGAASAEGLYSATIFATSVSDASRAASAPVSQMLVRALSMGVSTDKAAYRTNQTVIVSATVSGAGTPLAGVQASIVITSPAGKSQTLAATTNASGVASATTRLNKKDPAGTWAVRATASASGLSGSASGSFLVQ